MIDLPKHWRVIESFPRVAATISSPGNCATPGLSLLVVVHLINAMTRGIPFANDEQKSHYDDDLPCDDDPPEDNDYYYDYHQRTATRLWLNLVKSCKMSRAPWQQQQQQEEELVMGIIWDTGDDNAILPSNVLLWHHPNRSMQFLDFCLKKRIVPIILDDVVVICHWYHVPLDEHWVHHEWYDAIVRIDIG